MWIIILLRQGPFPREIVQFIAGLSQLSEVFFPRNIFETAYFFTPIIRVNEALNHPQICLKKMRFWCAYSLVSFERKVDSCKKKLVWLVWMVPYSVDKVVLSPRSNIRKIH